MKEVLTCYCGNQSLWEISGNHTTCMKCGRMYHFTEFLEFVIDLPKDGSRPRAVNPIYTKETEAKDE